MTILIDLLNIFFGRFFVLGKRPAELSKDFLDLFQFLEQIFCSFDHFVCILSKRVGFKVEFMVGKFGVEHDFFGLAQIIHRFPHRFFGE